MLEAGLDALANLFTIDRFLWLNVGVVVGLVVGILPGLGGTVGMALLIPFVFGMEPTAGIAMLIGMAAVTQTSDTFPSVLLGVPGSSGSQATIMDGYPLARQGEAGRALTVSFIASMLGGLFGALTLFGLIGLARPIILSLGSPELFMFALLGLSMVAVLGKGSALTGLTSGLLGMLIGLIGIAPQASQYRFTFESLYLRDGIPIAVLALGLFAIPEVVDLAIANRTVSERPPAGRLHDFKRSLRDVVENRWLVFRTSIIGTGIGMLPGVGGSVIDWIAYGVTKETSKNNENFGNGDIRGVIGPESANNAKEGGTLVPTLLFGIPGSGTSAMLLGGLLTLGIQPGPSMVSDNLDVTLTIAWSLALANIIGATLCLLLAGYIARLAFVPARALLPFLIVIMVAASYQSSRHWGDIAALVFVGCLGWVMKQTGFPRAPMLIGFVLAVSAERYLHLSMSIYGLGWIGRPIVLVIASIIVLLVFSSQVRTAKKQMSTRNAKRSLGHNDSEGD